MAITLTRSDRTVYATGPDGSPVSGDDRVRLAETLTYFSRTYDHASSQYLVCEERMYAVDPYTTSFGFPLGLLGRVTTALSASGVGVSFVGTSLTQDNAAALVTDVDGLLREFTLYPGNDDCLIAVAREDGGMITAPTGAGKSVLIRMICRLFYKARIHVATKSAVLASEIRDDLSSVIPDVGMVGGGSRRFGRVTVFVADSLHHGLGQSDILLLDEVHEMITPKYMSAVGRYRTAKVFGFTASPTGRHDGRDVEMEAMCGPVLYNMTYQEAVSGGRVVPITVHWLKTDGPVTTGMDPVERDRIAIWGNESRNRKIADYAAGIPADVQTMIMVRTIDHAVSLKKMLPDYQIVYAPGGMDQDRMTRYVEDGMLPPNEPIMTRQRMNDMKRDFAQGKLTKVIANYVWSTGVNFRHLSVLIRADGAKSDIRSVQIPGRISRRIPGVKESAVLVDCWDAFDPTLLDRSRARRASYRGRGWAETAESVTKPKRTVR